MGQEFLPGRLGVSAGVTIGLSIGLGGVGAPLLGLLADAHGLKAVFEAVAALPVIALLLTLWLPGRGVSLRSGARAATRAAHVAAPREPA
jgi:FSR family fosmidomycin resistance protein-like MFS transporter